MKRAFSWVSSHAAQSVPDDMNMASNSPTQLHWGHLRDDGAHKEIEQLKQLLAGSDIEAQAIFTYKRRQYDPNANNIWPTLRDPLEFPMVYYEAQESVPYPQTVNNPSGSSIVWPKKCIPTEIYEEVASYLSVDDVKCMRLVCKEFDKHVSQVMYKSMVIPFNPEIYGMLRKMPKGDVGGNRKRKVQANADLPLLWEDDELGEGFQKHNVFHKFGAHTRRLGMSFEVDEGMNQPVFRQLNPNAN